MPLQTERDIQRDMIHSTFSRENRTSRHEIRKIYFIHVQSEHRVITWGCLATVFFLTKNEKGDAVRGKESRVLRQYWYLDMLYLSLLSQKDAF